ncbi:MAG: type II toxin-antitoxin system HicA family toxin [Planctomycetes bacterium]|nr:type II toxin-antitoxin system HicA family toxin [Planctomycetota bacterium]
MGRLPRVSGAACVAALQRLGFAVVRRKGSHVVMRQGARGCVVPMHREIKTGTLHGILRQAGVTVEEFAAVL